MTVFHSETMVRNLNRTNEKYGIRTSFTSVWLEETGGSIKMFYCPHCRFPVAQYEGSVVTILPGSSPSKLPLIAQCRGRNCGIKYIFNLMLKTQ